MLRTISESSLFPSAKSPRNRYPLPWSFRTSDFLWWCWPNRILFPKGDMRRFLRWSFVLNWHCLKCSYQRASIYSAFLTSFPWVLCFLWEWKWDGREDRDIISSLGSTSPFLSSLCFGSCLAPTINFWLAPPLLRWSSRSLTLSQAKMRITIVIRCRFIPFLRILDHILAKAWSRILGARSWLLRLCNPTRIWYACPSLLCLLHICR